MATRIKEKALKRAENKDKRPQAHATNVRITAVKAGLVLDLVRGKKYDEALAILSNITNASAIVVKKLIMSAGANAEHNQNLSKADLFVSECYANQGPSMRRLSPRAKGMGHIIHKRTTHITVILDSVKA